MELKNKQRFFLSVFFFLSGVCFSTWASRIPTIKTTFALNDAELGTILLFMPVSSFIGVPISGWLVSRFDSRIPLSVALVMLVTALSCMGFCTTIAAIATAQCLFAFSMRILNISMNTQALTIQNKFGRNINGSFHGLWSTGGIIGVGVSTLFVAFQINMMIHFVAVSAIVLLIGLYSYRFLLQGDRSPSGNKIIIGKPNLSIVYLGLLIFFAALCEGGMFDWSGIYFKEIVKVELFTLGYLIFMVCMALSRFASDHVVEKIGLPKIYIMSSILVVSGISLAIVFPLFWTCMFGFCLVGLGAASIIPLTFTQASSLKKYSPGTVISILGTYGIVGAFSGPPLIGYLAQAFSLRFAFIAFAISGFMIIPISQLFLKHQKSLK